MTKNPLATLSGANLIAGEERRSGVRTFHTANPRGGVTAGVDFDEAGQAEIAAAAEAAADAFETYRAWSNDRVARLLRGIAGGLEDLSDRLLEVADAETALGLARLTGERSRTCGQLRAFADLVEEGSYVDAIIDRGDRTAEPPKPDLRRMQIPIGPVAVFGASNFPLAFSVPGGDTASALAARCPVVVKAHPSHAGTSELCGRAIQEAVRDAGAPSGLFSLIQGQTPEVGRALVLAPQVKAVGFTGSHAVGRALYDLAAGRPEPIPVYAEMGSLNPVFITGNALSARSAEIAEGFTQSITMGSGQFCTKPGLAFVPDDEAGERFVEQLVERLGRVSPGPLLNQGIRDALTDRLGTTTALSGVEVILDGGVQPGDGGCAPTLLSVDWQTFLEVPELLEEHFGPVSVVVRCPQDRLPEVAQHLEGTLAATVHAEDSDAEDVGRLLPLLQGKAGRLVWNGFPTGVAVTAAMHHGGPYPATTFPAHTSVGTTSVRRFLRPVSFQNVPEAHLPPALHDGNPLGIWRLTDGRWMAP
jgi:NADP-dependent aldehyde dehydrogenase